jgi:hypothetical protein
MCLLGLIWKGCESDYGPFEGTSQLPLGESEKNHKYATRTDPWPGFKLGTFQMSVIYYHCINPLDFMECDHVSRAFHLCVLATVILQKCKYFWHTFNIINTKAF